MGSRISFFLILPWIVLAEIQVAHHLRTGEWAPLLSSNVLDHASEWFVDWCVGTFPVGFGLGALLGLFAYAIARARVGITPREPARAPPPSSGSPR